MSRFGFAALASAAALLAMPAFAQSQPSGNQQSPSGGQAAQQPSGGGMMMGQDCGHMGYGGGPMQGPCYRVGQIANVQVQQTASGATVQLTAKQPGDVQEVQKLAEKFESCVSRSTPSGQGAQPGQSAPPAQSTQPSQP